MIKKICKYSKPIDLETIGETELSYIDINDEVITSSTIYTRVSEYLFYDSIKDSYYSFKNRKLWSNYTYQDNLITITLSKVYPDLTLGIQVSDTDLFTNVNTYNIEGKYTLSTDKLTVYVILKDITEIANKPVFIRVVSVNTEITKSYILSPILHLAVNNNSGNLVDYELTSGQVNNTGNLSTVLAKVNISSPGLVLNKQTGTVPVSNKVDVSKIKYYVYNNNGKVMFKIYNDTLVITNLTVDSTDITSDVSSEYTKSLSGVNIDKYYTLFTLDSKYKGKDITVNMVDADNEYSLEVKLDTNIGNE